MTVYLYVWTYLVRYNVCDTPSHQSLHLCLGAYNIVNLIWSYGIQIRTNVPSEERTQGRTNTFGTNTWRLYRKSFPPAGQIKRHEGDNSLPLANCVPPYFGLAYCVPPFFGLAHCVPLNNKNNHFGRFHLHKEDKNAICCMHMYNHSFKR